VEQASNSFSTSHRDRNRLKPTKRTRSKIRESSNQRHSTTLDLPGLTRAGWSIKISWPTSLEIENSGQKYEGKEYTTIETHTSHTVHHETVTPGWACDASIQHTLFLFSSFNSLYSAFSLDRHLRQQQYPPLHPVHHSCVQSPASPLDWVQFDSPEVHPPSLQIHVQVVQQV